MSIICWNPECKKDTGIAEDDYKDHTCPYCNFMISVYDPNQPDWLLPVGYKDIDEIYDNPNQEEDDMAIIDTSSIKLPFFKKEDLASGSEVVIESEVAKGGNYDQYAGTIRLPDGTLKRAGFNMTSISAMTAKWGNDTTKWVGQKLVFTIEDIINSKTKQVLKDCKIFKPL